MKDGAKIMYYLNEDNWRLRSPEDVDNYTLKDINMSIYDKNKIIITNEVFNTL
uniref:Uncharacterized protein n=1 Tax=Podoviridae sp. ct2m58 TaxID=2827721 RepID=A0A8S5TLX5_9CAUD|nr:MAG TPA: hypothetical protein [Podoviridae sp. ct2m58]